MVGDVPFHSSTGSAEPLSRSSTKALIDGNETRSQLRKAFRAAQPGCFQALMLVRATQRRGASFRHAGLGFVLTGMKIKVGA